MGRRVDNAEKVNSIGAGVNLPNTASLGEMGRLAMRSLQNIRYPLGV
jgi:hypothetical protein